MIEFVERNGHEWRTPDDDEAIGMMVGAGAGTTTERDFISWAKGHIS
jgi:prophage maintenance system killer protein